MKKIFIIAGEPSGDYLGSILLKDIRSLLDDVRVTGIGGASMAPFMDEIIMDMSQITVIGIAEVIPKILEIRRLINRTAQQIVDFNPDVLITVDFSGFNHRVAKKVKSLNSKITVVHYVAPPVWAWRPWRAKNMHKFIDLLLTLFPFEPKFFDQFNLKSVFVGHPVANDNYLASPPLDDIKKFELEYEIQPTEMKICFLPGSRDSEIKRHVKVVFKAINLLKREYKNIRIFIPTIPEKIDFLHTILSKYSNNFDYQIVTDMSERKLAMKLADMAIAASGTVTLELAGAHTPFITIYRTSWLTSPIVRLLIQTNSVCLINILARKTVVPELLQSNCTPLKIFKSFKSIADLPIRKERQKEVFSQVINSITSPTPKAAAKEIVKLILHN